MNIPNVLTILRLIMIPFFAKYLIEGNYKVAAIIFIVAGLTDVADGYIARKFNLVTSWGKIADPLADKLMVITALLILTSKGKIYPVVIIIMILKEMTMGLGSLFIYRNKKVVVSANWYGKMSSVFFFAAIILSILDFSFSNVLIYIAVASAIFALIRYIVDFVKMSNTKNIENTDSPS